MATHQPRIRVEEWISLRLRQIQKAIPEFDRLTSFKFGLPTCIHGKELTDAECAFEWPYLRKYQLPKSFECFDCNACCKHGTPLHPKKDGTAIERRERVSKECPECDPSITTSMTPRNKRLIHAHLFRKGLSVDAAKGLIQGCLITSFGQVVTKGGEWFVQAGGSKETEDLDAYGDKNGVGATSDTDAVSDSRNDTDGQQTDELGDPVWSGQTDFTRSAEHARARETEETVSTESFYEIKSSGTKWIVVKDGQIVTSNGHTRRFNSKQSAEQYVSDQLIKEAGQIEHSIKDVLAAVD